MKSAGADKDLALSELESLRGELRDSGNEAAEDAVMDVMDCVAGWCAAHARLF